MIVFLAFLDEDVLAVDDVFLGEVSGDVVHLLLVEAESVLLNHLACFAFGWENVRLHCEGVKYAKREFAAVDGVGRDSVEYGKEGLLVQCTEVFGRSLAEKHL